MLVSVHLYHLYTSSFFLIFKYTNTFQKCYVFLNKCRAHPQLEANRLLNPEEYSQPLLNGDCPENEHSTTATPDPRDDTYPGCGNSFHGYSSVQ